AVPPVGSWRFRFDGAQRFAALNAGKLERYFALERDHSVVKVARGADACFSHVAYKIAGPQARPPSSRVAGDIHDAHRAKGIEITAALGEKGRRGSVFNAHATPSFGRDI